MAQEEEDRERRGNDKGGILMPSICVCEVNYKFKANPQLATAILAYLEQRGMVQSVMRAQHGKWERVWFSA